MSPSPQWAPRPGWLIWLLPPPARCPCLSLTPAHRGRTAPSSSCPYPATSPMACLSIIFCVTTPPQSRCPPSGWWWRGFVAAARFLNKWSEELEGAADVSWLCQGELGSIWCWTLPYGRRRLWSPCSVRTRWGILVSLSYSERCRVEGGGELKPLVWVQLTGGGGEKGHHIPPVRAGQDHQKQQVKAVICNQV